MVQSFLIAVVCLPALGTPATRPKAGVVPSYEIALFCEYNNFHTAGIRYLSDRSTGMPATEMSLTASCFLATDAMANELVVFNVTQPTDGAYVVPVSGSWPVSEYTDSNGQVTIQVKGTPDGGAGGGNIVQIVATWDNWGLQAFEELNIKRFTQSTSDSPAHSDGPLSNPTAIKYSDSTTWMSTATASARSVWAATGKVGFTTGTPVQISFTEYFAQNTVNARTITSLPLPREIEFNKFNLNNDPYDAVWAKFPPASVRHHLQSTAAHELGHALGLAHNLSSLYALMCGDYNSYTMSSQRYFAWAVQAPVSGELSTFHTLYP